jgi:hypothetical protein
VSKCRLPLLPMSQSLLIEIRFIHLKYTCHLPCRDRRSHPIQFPQENLTEACARSSGNQKQSQHAVEQVGRVNIFLRGHTGFPHAPSHNRVQVDPEAPHHTGASFSLGVTRNKSTRRYTRVAAVQQFFYLLRNHICDRLGVVTTQLRSNLASPIFLHCQSETHLLPNHSTQRVSRWWWRNRLHKCLNVSRAPFDASGCKEHISVRIEINATWIV